MYSQYWTPSIGSTSFIKRHASYWKPFNNPPITSRSIPTRFRRSGRGIRRKHWINWQELWPRDFPANQGRKSGGILDVFPTFSDEEWTEKIRPQPQTIYSVLPNGGGFSAAPLKPASYQCSCRDKNIAPGGISTESFWEMKSKEISVFYRESPPIL